MKNLLENILYQGVAMKILVFIGIGFLYFGQAIAQSAEQDLSIGQEINVPGYRQVNIVREFEDDSSILEKGENCSIKYGYRLEILGFSPSGELALVKNLTEHGLEDSCPQGVIFFLSPGELIDFENRYSIKKEREIAFDILVSKMLEESDLSIQAFGFSVGQEITVPDNQWVAIFREIEYIEHLDGDDSSLEQRESCLIKHGYKLQILGFSPSDELTLVKNLYGRSKYFAQGRSSKDFCYQGAVFLLPTKELSDFEDRFQAISAHTLKQLLRMKREFEEMMERIEEERILEDDGFDGQLAHKLLRWLQKSVRRQELSRIGIEILLDREIRVTDADVWRELSNRFNNLVESVNRDYVEKNIRNTSLFIDDLNNAFLKNWLYPAIDKYCTNKCVGEAEKIWKESL